MNAAKDDTRAILDVAAAMDMGADAAASVHLADETLQGLTDEYVRMLRKGARAARAMARAANANDVQGLQQAMGDISKVESTESSIVKRSTAFCACE